MSSVPRTAGQNQYNYRTRSGQTADAKYAVCTVAQTEPLPLATLRRRQLLSQRGLAARAHVALSTVYLLEAGKTGRVTFKVMRALSDALGVPPESIVEFRRVIQPD